MLSPTGRQLSERAHIERCVTLGESAASPNPPGGQAFDRAAAQT
jgi:hypothetical protein